MVKRVLLVLVASAVVCLSLPAQQLTRFAVVDLPRVYTAFLRDSRAVRELEEQSRRVQTEIDRMTREILELKSRQADTVVAGNQNETLRLENEIYRKSEFLKEYHRTKTAELEDRKRRLAQSDSFLDQVNDEIRWIAEREGYSMVLNLKGNSGILWYSPTVDITDTLIHNLQNKAR
jgi:outer membrane protein